MLSISAKLDKSGARGGVGARVLQRRETWVRIDVCIGLQSKEVNVMIRVASVDVAIDQCGDFKVQSAFVAEGGVQWCGAALVSVVRLGVGGDSGSAWVGIESFASDCG